MNNQRPTRIIIEKKTGRKIKLFEGNRFIKKSFLRIKGNDIANIIIRKPGRWHNGYLIFINIKDEGVGGLFKIFLQKKSPHESIELKGNLIEINMKDNEGRKLPSIEKRILEPFKQYYNIDI